MAERKRGITDVTKRLSRVGFATASGLVAACAPQPLPRGEVIYVVVPPFEESGQLADQPARGNTSAVPDAPLSTPLVSDGSALSRGPFGGGIPPGEVLPVEVPSEASVDPSLCNEGDSRTEEQILYINTTPPVGVRARREPGQNAQSDGVVPQATPVTSECLRIVDGQEWFKTRYRVSDGEGGFWVLKDYLAQEPVIPVRPPAPPVVSPPAQSPLEPQPPQAVVSPDSGSGGGVDTSCSVSSRPNLKEFPTPRDYVIKRIPAPDQTGPRVLMPAKFVRAQQLEFGKWGLVVRRLDWVEVKIFIKDSAVAANPQWQLDHGARTQDGVIGEVNNRATRVRQMDRNTLEFGDNVSFNPCLWKYGDVLNIEFWERSYDFNMMLDWGPDVRLIYYYP